MGSSSPLHPLHPALAHFPVAFWLGSSASDLIALKSGNTLFGSALVIAGGFCGGTLVYGYGVGVSWRAQPRE